MMPRTTVNIDQPILDELKRLQKTTGKPLGQLMSQLLAQALAQQEQPESPAFEWQAQAMGQPHVPLEDKERLYRVLDS
ncbi:MAG: hypothetical protein KC910_28425 [Candidatus Eremiobacteraeota bacterium]|nr:hypothetical protein [Candidatus Eremiobacteraeota bacterium]